MTKNLFPNVSFPNVSEEQFRTLLENKLGESWERALATFRKFGDNLTYDVYIVLRHAADQKKVDEVLYALEEHYESHLKSQNPEVRGIASNNLGVNPTEVMFLNICEKILGLKPV